MEKTYKANKGFTNALIAAFIGLMVVVIIVVSAVIPTVNEAISNAELTGATGTLVGLVPLLIAAATILLVMSITA